MQAEAQSSTHRRAYTLAVLVIVFTSSHVDRQIIGILAQPIKEAFALSDIELGLLTGVSFALFYATLGMPMAMWADRGNRRNIIALSISLWSAMTALCGLAQSYVQLLLARIGVAVGEAGSNPPSHSIIADLYAPEERATAMAIFATGVNLGIMVGYLIGGWVNEWLDWRWAFIIAGLPGLLIALVVRFTVNEPPRGLSEPDREVEVAPPFMTVVHTLWSRPVLRNTVIANTLCSFAGYATVAWVPTFFIRVHEMSSGEVGTMLAGLIGIGGAIGTFLGGWLADRLAPRSEGWRAWVVAISALIYVPFAWLCYTTESTTTAILAFSVPAAFGGVYIGCSYAIIQSHTPVAMRSVAAAINLFILNIVGLGLGPLLVGGVSDFYAADVGNQESLRYGMLAAVAVMFVTAGWYIHAGRLLHRTGSGV